MEGDFTRNSDDWRAGYSGVLMQQGRVQLDADWNEQWLIQTRALRGVLRDLIGRHGGPKGRVGFRIDGQAGDPQNLTLGTGSYYVDGLRCEQSDEAATVLLPRERGNYLVFLDVWERHVNVIEDPRIREVALLGPDTATRAQVVWRVRFLTFDNEMPAAEYTDALVEPLLDGLRNRRRRRLAARAFTTNANTDPCLPSPTSQYRGRENQLYRVQIHEALPRGSKPVVKAPPKENAREKKAAREKAAADKLALEKGGFEQDDAGDPVLFTFKWSRDNGSVVFPIVGQPRVGSVLTEAAGDGAVEVTVPLAHLGRDERFGLVPGDIVELVHDAQTLEQADDGVLTEGGRDPGRPGALGRVLAPIDTDELTVRLAMYPDDIAELPENTLHPYLRRWDQRSHADRKLTRGAVAVRRSELDKWLPLEDGVEVLFERAKLEAGKSDAEQRSGDYWLIPARTATGDVIWPSVAPGTSQPARLAPHGPIHHYAPLALLAWNGNALTTGPYGVRRSFSPLAINEWDEANGG